MTAGVCTRSFATARQRAKIAQLCMALCIKETLEEDVTTSEEASQLIRQMCDWLRTRRVSSVSGWRETCHNTHSGTWVMHR